MEKRQLLLGLMFTIGLFGQLILTKAQSPFSVSAGMGRYELTHIAAHWHVSPSSSLALLAGTNFGINNNTQFSTGMAFSQVLFSSKEWKFKPGYSISSIFWTRDDELYYFKTLSFPLMLTLNYQYSSKLNVRFESGTTISEVLVSDRKQNVTSGFPEYINANFKLSVIYRLPSTKKAASK